VDGKGQKSGIFKTSWFEVIILV